MKTMNDIDDDVLDRDAAELGTTANPPVSAGVMPGRLYLVDTSAFARIGQRRVRQVLAAIVAGVSRSGR